MAAAKAAHLAEVAKAKGAFVYAGHSGYVGPYAVPVVTPEGYLADTPEVASAKAAHHAEVAKAKGAVVYTGYYNPYYYPYLSLIHI